MLNGQKTYISGVEHADAVLVVARTRLDDGSLGLPSLALVDVDAPGFTREAIPMRIMGAAIAGGAGRRALEAASAYARERNVWGVPIGPTRASRTRWRRRRSSWSSRA